MKLRRSRSVGLVALAVLAAVAISACGSTPPPSLVQLQSQGNRICEASSGEIRRIHTPTSAAEGEAFLKRGIGVLGPELRQLRKLRALAPTEASEVYGTAVTAFAAQLAALKGAVRALQRNQDPVLTFQALQQRLKPLESQADGAWEALQMPACADD